MGDGQGTTRRSFLARGGAVGAGLMLGNLPSVLTPTTAFAAANFATGYNDAWFAINEEPGHFNFVPALANSGAQYIRQGVQWEEVQPRERNEWNWGRLRALIARLDEQGASDVRVLPIFGGAPAWAKPRHPENAYCDPEFDEDFGHFVAEGLREFEGHTLAAEIWNEPNRRELGAVPYGRFAELILNAWHWVWAYNTQRRWAGEKLVVTGGLSITADSFSGPRSMPWEEYLERFQAQIRASANYKVGIHCYADRTANEPRAVADSIVREFDRVKTLTERQIWITETGASSDEPFRQSGQAQALVEVVEKLNQRSRCRAMIVHRFYNDPVNEGPTSAFHEFGVRFEDHRPKTAYERLRVTW